MDNERKYPEGHFVQQWMAIGIAIFSGVGIPLSIATDNSGFIGLGPAIGVALGMAVGTSIEARHKKEGRIRPMTEEEKQRKKIALTVALILLSALALFGVYMYLMPR